MAEKELSDIEKLSELRDKGIITSEEFDVKKKQILDSINFSNNQNTVLSSTQTPPKKTNGCLIVIAVLGGIFILFVVMVFVVMIFSSKDDKKIAENGNEVFLSSNKPKNQQQKIDSAKLANKKFNDLPDSEKISILNKELEQKNLTKVQREEIEVEIKGIKQLAFAKTNISAWDGSNPKLERAIKKSMNDPDSYEHVQTTFSYKKDKVIATMIYRGNNAFGAKVLGKILGTFDYDGNLINIENEN
ncbi:SHOCT domain-containing protein [Chryseobacterium sp.]|uniref:SHOCT domain-containing protein n=1 Tax=Chryseobacterium sp. TaxID=1871047 RepID=UPI0028A1A208|nr:SHOCT domain-containing protein [Chryseobacterium sp.]